MSLTWTFEVKWDGTNWTDEASRMRGLTVKRGRQHFVAPGGRGLEPMRPGEAVIDLLNTDDRYNPYNDGSPIYGDIAPGKLARLKVTHTTEADWSEENTGAARFFDAVWGTSSSNVYVADQNEKVWRWNGSAWSAVQSSLGWNPYNVWGSGASDVVVVGSGGHIIHYNGAAWSAMTSNTTKTLLGVWGSSSSDVFAVGFDGTIMHYNGAAWSAMTSNTTEHLTAVWGTSSSDVFAVGENGEIMHYNGAAWSAMTSNTTKNLQGVWGTAANDVYAVGNDGTIMHYNGAAWSAMTSNTTALLLAVWGADGSNIWAVGDGGVIQYYDGLTWTGVSSGTDDSLHGVWGTSASNVYAAGFDTSTFAGAILHMSQTSTTYDVLYGQLADLRIYDDERGEYARVTVRDGLEYLQNQTIFLDCNFGSGGASSDRFAGNIGNILTAASWPWGTDLASDTDFCTWWGGDNYETPAATLIWELRESDLGEFYVARDGDATYVKRLAAMPAATVTLDDDDLQLAYDLPMPWDYIRNKCMVRSSHWYAEANGYYALMQGPGATLTNQQKYEHPKTGKVRLRPSGVAYNNLGGVIENAYQGMYAAGQSADVYRATLTSGVLADMRKTAGGSSVGMNVNPSTMTAFAKCHGYSNGAQHFGGMNIFFYNCAFFDLLNNQDVQSDPTSVSSYGERILTILAKWRFHSDSFSAAKMAAIVISSLKDARSYPRIKIANNPALQFARELRECIAIDSETLMLDEEIYHIGQIEHRWLDASGQVVETWLKMEPAIYGDPDEPGVAPDDEEDSGGSTPEPPNVIVNDLMVEGDLDVAGDVTIDGTLTLAAGAAVNEFSTDGTLAGDSDTAVPTEGAVKEYVEQFLIPSGGLIAADDFNRSDGALGVTQVGAYLWEGTTGAVASNACVITPTFGTSLIDGATGNGNMETGDPPTGWIANGGSTLSSVADERTGGAGSKSMNAVRGTNDNTAYRGISITKDTWYVLDGWTKNIDATTGCALTLVGANGTQINNYNATTSWRYEVRSGWGDATATRYPRLYVVGTAGQQGRFDDVRVRPLTTASLFAGFQVPYQDVDVSVNLTLPYNACAGLFVAGDAASPSNAVLAYCNGTTAYMNSIASGAITAKTSGAITYSAGAALRITRSGDTLTLYYNGSQVGSPQTITGLTGRYVGLFSTYSGNILDSLTVRRA